MCRHFKSEGRLTIIRCEKPLWSVLFRSLRPQPIHFWDLNPWKPKVLSAVFYVLISCFSPCFHAKTAIDATGTTSTKLPTHVGKIINIFPLSAAHYGWYTLITDGIYGAPRPHTPPALAEASTGLCARKGWWRREGGGKLEENEREEKANKGRRWRGKWKQSKEENGEENDGGDKSFMFILTNRAAAQSSCWTWIIFWIRWR